MNTHRAIRLTILFQLQLLVRFTVNSSVNVDSTDTIKSPLFNWYILRINYVLGSMRGTTVNKTNETSAFTQLIFYGGTSRCFRSKLEARKYQFAIISMKKIIRTCDRK